MHIPPYVCVKGVDKWRFYAKLFAIQIMVLRHLYKFQFNFETLHSDLQKQLRIFTDY